MMKNFLLKTLAITECAEKKPTPALTRVDGIKYSTDVNGVTLHYHIYPVSKWELSPDGHLKMFAGDTLQGEVRNVWQVARHTFYVDQDEELA